MTLLARGNCYMALGQDGEAEKEFLKLAAIAGKDKEIDRYVWAEIYREILLSLGNFYLLTRRFDKADTYAKQLQTVVGDLITMEMRSRIELFRSRLDSSLGRPASAMKHFENFHRMNDSLFGVQKAVQIQELQIKYAIDQKDKDIRLQSADIQLLTKQNQL